MEPTTQNKKGSMAALWIVIIILVILGIIFFGRGKMGDRMEKGDDNFSESTDRNDLEADLNTATSGDNEASLQQMDREFQ